MAAKSEQAFTFENAAPRACMCCGRLWREHTEQEWRLGCPRPSAAIPSRRTEVVDHDDEPAF